AKFGVSLAKETVKWGEWVNSKAREDLDEFYPRAENEQVLAYIWARTIRCPSCNLVVPLSPNWWLSRPKDKKERIAVRIKVPRQGQGDEATFDIVDVTKDFSLDPNKGTVEGGRASCPRPGCGNTIPEDYIKKEAQQERMGHQLYALFIKKKTGPKKWEKTFRLPSLGDLKAYEKAVHAVEKED